MHQVKPLIDVFQHVPRNSLRSLRVTVPSVTPISTRSIDSNQCTSLMVSQQPQQLRDQGCQISECRAPRGKHKNRQRQSTKVLLILEVLIGSDERIVFRRSQFQQFTVFDASPAGALHRFNFVSIKQTRQTPRQRFIKQQAHALRQPRARVPTQSQPARV